MGPSPATACSPPLSERPARRAGSGRAARDASLRVWAPAKVNLFLEVLARRPDGYHEVETLMVAVSLYDTLTFTDDPAGPVRLACDRPELSVGPDNLVVRAAELLRQRTGHAGGVSVQLTKRIPTAAGLAGGSSDAAATLAGLNRLWKLGLGPDALAALAAELGSDVPFFLDGPAAWCTGRGERVEKLPLGAPLHLVVACPAAGLSTAEVYRNVTVPDRPADGAELRAATRRGDVEAMGRLLHNRLQEPAVRLCPAVDAVLGRLRELGAVGCLMSGSGSSVVALCRGRRDAVEAARRLAAETPAEEALRVVLVRSCV
jgi:4-diphosphocytidyl-2-C-methyl-D-erythritol kinase